MARKRVGRRPRPTSGLGADLADQELGLNPVGVAAGVEDAGEEPILVEFAIVEHIGDGAKNAHAPTVRAGAEGKRVGLKQNDETVLFCEDGLGLRAGARDVVGKNARDVALGDSIEDSQRLAHSPLSVRMRMRAASGVSAFSG